MHKFMALLIGLILIVACGYREGVIQKADKSYLMFTGNWRNASVQIDNADPFRLDNLSIDSHGQERRAGPDNKLYQISPGKHMVRVYRNGEVVVKRILMLENNTIREVQIP